MFCITNVVLGLLYYDADYVGKKSVAQWCLIITDFMSVMQSKLSVIQVLVTVVRYHTVIDLEKSQKIID